MYAYVNIATKYFWIIIAMCNLSKSTRDPSINNEYLFILTNPFIFTP